jgi:hypothetical protein
MIEARPMVILRPKHGIRMMFTKTTHPESAHPASLGYFRIADDSSRMSSLIREKSAANIRDRYPALA